MQAQSKAGSSACPSAQRAARRATRCWGMRPAAAVAAAEGVQTINLALGDRSYPIYVGRGLLSDGELLRRHIAGDSCLVITNETIAPLYLQRVVDQLSAGGSLRVATVVLRDGEEYKTLTELTKVFEGALAARLDRRTTFVALGGGVVGDMAGFAAASYQRGVSFLQLPTSLMAMVDSSVGGKTGVNMPGGKNMVGAFWQPRAVLCDTEVLATLPDRELASGLAEVVKYGLIRDAELFGWLEAGGAADVLARKHGALAHAVSASCTNKAAVVGADERETDDSAAGGRATLNLGHTFGHAIEASQGYGAWLHGEAVAIGTAMAADLSHRLGWIDDSVLRRTRDLLAACHLPTAAPAGMSAAAFSQLMAVDKKAARGFVRLILLRGALGGCVFTHEYDAAALAATLDAFCDEAAPRSTPPARIALLQH